MKDIASRRLLPEMNSIANFTSEETAIGGEGEPVGPIAAHKIEEKLGIPGIPYQNCLFLVEDVGESGASRKKQRLSQTNGVVWGRQRLDLCQCVFRGEPDFPNSDGPTFHGDESEIFTMSPDWGNDLFFRDVTGIYECSGEEVVGGDDGI